MPAPAPRSDAPLRIAYLTYRGKPHVGGQGVYTRHLTKALVDLGHHVEVLSGQPYPELDERVPMTKLPSLDVFNDHYPGRFPAYWEIKTREDLLELAQFSTGTFPEPLAFSFRALRAAAAACGRVRPRPRQPVPRLRDPQARAADPDDRHAAPPDHQGPPAGDGPRAEPPQADLGRALVLVRQDAGPRRLPAAAHRRRQRELDPRHPRRHGRELRPHAAGAGRRRPRAVPARVPRWRGSPAG